MDDIGRRLQFYRATAAYLQVENSEEGLSNCDKIPTEYMENHVISLDSCGEYYLAVDGEIGGRP